ncbi:MAG: hypothetical protein AAGE52_00090 [Myxococcota bacterium]
MQWFRLALGAVCLLGISSSSAPVRADAFELPPPPSSHPPRIAAEFRLDVVFPLDQKPICPSGSRCVFGGGAGLGALVEWRWPSGLGLGLGYDAWFLDGNGVHELTTMQSLRVGVRYQFLRDRQTHPWIGAAFGGLLFGDTFRADAAGGLVDVQLGVEFELSASLAFTIGATLRWLSTTSFRTSSDGVERAEGFGPVGAAALSVGLVLLPST